MNHPPNPAPVYDGLLLVDKPLRLSSMDVLRVLRRGLSAAGAKVRGKGPGRVKTGHAGTLDPLATGLLICCVGRATRAVDRLMGQPKQYVAEVDLSAFTTTDDREGERAEVAVDHPPAEADVLDVLPGFVGVIEQAPPAYSAIHVAGRRAYELARSGEAVDLPTRPVRVDGIRLEAYAWPVARLVIDCGKGVYIRSLARDLGRALGTGGHLASLRRTAIGAYRVADAVGIERCEAAVYPGDLLAVPPVEADAEGDQASSGNEGSR
ncbi:tRNA pseudouridine(55) synthase TruB [Mucisphaera calidilacus]|uniref:tRNA pseudouridine synthase B n=1 Tax=Mucisphaera calidilacus TaxID=2527982 RepID=A0A518BUU8_9BACT|nr:tRNA pseudouridine(55) synthase TruB [Mucisphaera calidilacus]QDU70763.1 tRNA pseudouridine synthase B [Mucisphaera calidilacus]